METMDLCAIAKVPVSDAKAFVKAKTPIATVRSELARRAAAAWDSVVQEINSKMPANARR